MVRSDSSDDTDESSGSNILRRTTLKAVGAAGLAGMMGTGVATAQGSPFVERCDCEFLFAKYEFEQENDEECEFVFEEGADVVDITYDPTSAEYNKSENQEVETCEPIRIDISPSEGWEITRICAFGGGEHDDRDEFNGEDRITSEETYEFHFTVPDFEPAISNVVFCLEAVEERFAGYQIDLIEGEVLETLDPDAGQTYCMENRLLQAKWQDGTFDVDCGDCWDGDCDVIQADITVENDTAFACINPEVADNFALVVYGTPSQSWDPDLATLQVLYDADETPNTDGCFEVDLPPLE